MQDKEFDDLFHAKLDGFEMEPSAQVWENIDAELNGKRKKSIFPFLSIAASVILLIAAAILFIPKKEIVKPGHSNKNGLAHTQAIPPVVKPHAEAPVVAPVIKNTQTENTTEINRVAVVHQPVKKETLPAKTSEQPEQAVQKQEPVKDNNEQLIAAVPEIKQPEVTNPVVPGPETQLTTKTNAVEAVTTKPVLASTEVPAVQQTKTVKRRGIHSFGDLVNIVVAKVDKRKDKVIEFTDTDDDESTITAVNMGPIKIKKDK